eukprot:1157408-Pelagomonas_calceolata.AAC.13
MVCKDFKVALSAAFHKVYGCNCVKLRYGLGGQALARQAPKVIGFPPGCEATATQTLGQATTI